MDSRVSFLRFGGGHHTRIRCPDVLKDAESVVNTMVCIRFPVLRKLEVWVSRGRVQVSFGRVSGDPGVTFSCF